MELLTCSVCENQPEPCRDCRRRTHERWHRLGWWWVQPQECHVNCPAVRDGRVQVSGWAPAR